MRQHAAEFLSSLDADGDRLARHGFDDREARRWLEYRPRPRPGVCVADLGKAGRKAAHRLLATGLPPAAYAQAIAVMSLEEVLDRREGWARGRHGDDYWVSVFGDPGGPAPWGWRFEGHHLSVSMTLVGDDVSGAPIFLGANPHRVSRAGRTVLSPLAEEEALGLALLDAMSTTARKAAVVSPTAPDDIRSGPSGSASPLEPAGVGSRSLGPVGRAALDSLSRSTSTACRHHSPYRSGTGSATPSCSSRGRGGSAPAVGTTTGCRRPTCSSSTTTRPRTGTTPTPSCDGLPASSARTCWPPTGPTCRTEQQRAQAVGSTASLARAAGPADTVPGETHSA